MSTSAIGIYLPHEVWTSDWSANTKIVFGYLWKRQGRNGCAWPFQGTMAAELKQPNRRTIQTSIDALEASGHLRRLATSSRSRVAYQLRVSVVHDWPRITSDAARRAKILPSQGCTICAAGDAEVAQPSSSKLGKKSTQGKQPTSDRTYVDNIDEVFDDEDDLVSLPSETASSSPSGGQTMTFGLTTRGVQ